MKVKLLNGKEIYLEETEDGFIEVEKPINTRFIPSIDEYYGYLDRFNCVLFTKRNRYGDDNYYKKASNENRLFRTKEETERKKEIFDFIHSKRKLFTRKEWEDNRFGRPKYRICAKLNSKCLGVATDNNSIIASYHFETREIAQEVIDFVGYEDWLKYVLNIYED